MTALWVAHLAGSVPAGLATAALGWLTISAVLP